MHKPRFSEPSEPNEDQDQMIEAFETLLANLGMPEREFGHDHDATMAAKNAQLLRFIEDIKAKYPTKYFSILIHRIGKYSAAWTNYPRLREEVFIPLFEKIIQLMREANEQE